MPPTPAALRPLPIWFMFGGLFFATWLAIFFHDEKRPLFPQERADRLAAANYAAFSFTAPTPPFPAHWAQMLTGSAAAPASRYAVTREPAALLIAASGGQPRVAAALAFGLAAGALAWCASRYTGGRLSPAFLLCASALVCVAAGRDWQMIDPYPFLVLAAGSLFFGGWIRLRESVTASASCALASGLGLLFLCQPWMGVLGALTMATDRLISSIKTEYNALSWRSLLPSFAAVVAVISFLVVRNEATTGEFLRSPRADYVARFTTIPQWWWQELRAPQTENDPVIERNDELVGVPSAGWSNPVYRTWLDRVAGGLAYGGGAAISLIAILSALALPLRSIRPALLTAGGILCLSFLRLDFASSWWPLITPALLALALNGVNHTLGNTSTSTTRRLTTAFALTFAITLPVSPRVSPSDAERDFHNRKADVAKKIAEDKTPALVFVSLDSTANATLEPADLPRDWTKEKILFARDLGLKKNSALSAALPDRKPWRIIVFKDRIGLQPWTPALDAKATNPPAGPPASAPVNAPSAAPAPVTAPAG